MKKNGGTLIVIALIAKRLMTRNHYLDSELVSLPQLAGEEPKADQRIDGWFVNTLRENGDMSRYQQPAVCTPVRHSYQYRLIPLILFNLTT